MAEKLMEMVIINKVLMDKVGITREDITAEAERLMQKRATPVEEPR